MAITFQRSSDVQMNTHQDEKHDEPFIQKPSVVVRQKKTGFTGNTKVYYLYI